MKEKRGDYTIYMASYETKITRDYRIQGKDEKRERKGIRDILDKKSSSSQTGLLVGGISNNVP